MFRYEPFGNGGMHRNRFTGAMCYAFHECWFEHEWERMLREEQAKAAKVRPKTDQFGGVLVEDLPNDLVPVPQRGEQSDTDVGLVPKKR